MLSVRSLRNYFWEAINNDNFLKLFPTHRIICRAAVWSSLKLNIWHTSNTILLSRRLFDTCVFLKVCLKYFRMLEVISCKEPCQYDETLEGLAFCYSLFISIDESHPCRHHKNDLHDDNIVLQVCQILSLRLLQTANVPMLIQAVSGTVLSFFTLGSWKGHKWEKLNWCPSIKYLP